jgi:hypothetical protein
MMTYPLIIDKSVFGNAYGIHGKLQQLKNRVRIKKGSERVYVDVKLVLPEFLTYVHGKA